jgi:hypothetical protein
MLLLAVVKDEKLIKHLSFDLEHVTWCNSVSIDGGTRQGQSLHAAATGEEAGGRNMDESLPLLVETRCRVGWS